MSPENAGNRAQAHDLLRDPWFTTTSVDVDDHHDMRAPTESESRFGVVCNKRFNQVEQPGPD